jgi:hypothetical protein
MISFPIVAALVAGIIAGNPIGGPDADAESVSDIATYMFVATICPGDAASHIAKAAEIQSLLRQVDSGDEFGLSHDLDVLWAFADVAGEDDLLDAKKVAGFCAENAAILAVLEPEMDEWLRDLPELVRESEIDPQAATKGTEN